MTYYFYFRHNNLNDGKECCIVWSDSVSNVATLFTSDIISDSIKTCYEYIIFDRDAFYKVNINKNLNISNKVNHEIAMKIVVGDNINDSINPPHYKLRNGLEVIHILEDIGIAEDYCRGNAIKYLIRAGRKNNVEMIEDLKKAQWYVNKLVDLLTYNR